MYILFVYIEQASLCTAAPETWTLNRTTGSTPTHFCKPLVSQVQYVVPIVAYLFKHVFDIVGTILHQSCMFKFYYLT